MRVFGKISLFVIVFLIVLWIIFWFFSRKTFSAEYGISFNQNHAASLGLDWKQAYTDILSELHPKHVRVAAMWSEVEIASGVYDFADVDMLLNTAEQLNAQVLLVVGQKAPRWPECHVPEWVSGYTQEEYRAHLFSYIQAVVKRYANHPALALWQVENEPFIRFEFGDCAAYRKDLVMEEIDLVRSLDPNHRIVVTDSGELSTWRRASRAGDIFGTTLYRIVETPWGFTFRYDWLPAGFYRIKSRLFGRGYDDFFVSELQTEPWFTDSNPTNTPIEQQEKTMDPKRLQAHIDYASHVGASRVYLWGAEWWYFMKTQKADARYWDVVKEVFSFQE